MCELIDDTQINNSESEELELTFTDEEYEQLSSIASHYNKTIEETIIFILEKEIERYKNIMSTNNISLEEAVALDKNIISNQ